MHLRTVATYLSTILMIVMAATTLRAQDGFEQADGPYGGGIFDNAASADGTIYVITGNFDAYRSDDDGRSWRRLTSNASDSVPQWLEDVAADSAGRLYVAGDHGIWMSTDRGESWAQYSRATAVNSAGEYHQIADIQVTRSGVVFVAYYSNLGRLTFARSTDHGATFSRVEMPGGDSMVVSMMTTPNGTVLASTGAAVYRSTDDGVTWQTSTVTIMSGDTLGFIDSRRGQLWMQGDNSRALQRSTDDGVSWQSVVTEGMPVAPIITDMTTTDAGTVLASVDGIGMFRSVDGGATWTPSGDPTDLIVAPPSGTVVAGSDIPFRSVDDGINWLPSTQGLITSFVTKITEGPNGLLFAAASNGPFMSTNRGATWDSIPGAPQGRIRDVQIDRQGRLWITADGAGINRWGGGGWTRISNGVSASRVGDLIFATDGRAYATSDSGMHYSSDGGETWVRSEDPIARVQTTVVELAPDGAILAGTTTQGVIRSTDRGVTWSAASDGLSHSLILSLLAARNGMVYAGARGSLYRSIDSGRTWQNVGRHQLLSEPRGLSEGLDGVIYAGNYEIARSTDNGLTWNMRIDPPFANYFLIPWIQQLSTGEILHGTLGAGIGRMVPDLGERWKRVQLEGINATAAAGSVGLNNLIATGSGLFRLLRPQMPKRWELFEHQIAGSPRINALAFDDAGELIHAATADGLYSSSRNGEWTRLEGDLPSGAINAVAVDPVAFVTFAGTSSGIHVSFNQGANWSPAAGPTTAVTSFLVIGNRAAHVLATAAGGGVWRTEDRGSSWTRITSGLPESDVVALALAADGDIYAATGSGVYRSSDAGSSWSALAGLVGQSVTAVTVNSHGIIFAGTGGGVHRSTDGGATFRRVNTEYDGPVSSLAVMADGMVIATTPESGAWQSSPDGAVASIERQTKRASETLVLAIDGNPLRSSSLVRFASRRGGATRLELVDMSGRVVTVLLDRTIEPGERVVPIDREGLAAGAYLLRLSQSEESVALPIVVQ